MELRLRTSAGCDGAKALSYSMAMALFEHGRGKSNRGTGSGVSSWALEPLGRQPVKFIPTIIHKLTWNHFSVDSLLRSIPSPRATDGTAYTSKRALCRWEQATLQWAAAYILRKLRLEQLLNVLRIDPVMWGLQARVPLAAQLGE